MPGDGGQRFGHDAAMASLGITTLEVGPGRAVLAMAVRPEHCNHRGELSRGTAFTLADAAIALASNSYGPVALLTHADATWLADAGPGDRLIARCEVQTRDGGQATFLSRVLKGDTVIGVVSGTTRTPRGA